MFVVPSIASRRASDTRSYTRKCYSIVVHIHRSFYENWKICEMKNILSSEGLSTGALTCGLKTSRTSCVAQVLSERQGLLMLLLGGISSLVLALVAGLDDMNVIKALFFSVTCYGITTVLVARSALRNGNQTNLCDGKPKLTSAEVMQIIEAVHEEDFVRNDELDYCDLPCLRNILNSRKLMSQDAVTGTEVSECMSQDLETTKKNLIAALKLRRKCSDSCCVCLDEFIPGDRIRVLPGCSHEFHNKCIDEWARTFAVNKKRIHHHVKSGNPSCPLCKTIIGNIQPCAPT
jgi:hypothetical protein